MLTQQNSPTSASSHSSFSHKMYLYREKFNQLLQQELHQFQQNAPHMLLPAIQYACQSGKRIRPMLIYLAGEFLSVPDLQLQTAAMAVELIHSYSLIHDDLPAMDNDDLRRGQPACHIKFDEATAILAGDAMQTLAFELLSTQDKLSSQTKLDIITYLARASGLQGMAGGQAFDLYAENKTITLDELEAIHCQKTQKLILCCAQIAIAASHAPKDMQEALLRYTQNIGLAFQVHDDVLDVVMNSDVLGKPQGSDTQQGKSTYCSLLGLEGAKNYALTLHHQAIDALSPWPQQNGALLEFANYLLKRNH